MRSMMRIHALAANTFREAIRNKLLYTLLGFGVVMIVSGVVLSTLSYVEIDEILQDIGMSAIRLFGAGIAIFVGIGLIHGEVDRRTIFTILSKPVSRAEFLIGKWAGLTVTVWLQLVLMAVAFVLVSVLSGAPVTSAHAIAIALIGLELMVLVAIATLFSAFTTPMLASFFTVGLWLIGHFSRDFNRLGAQSDAEQVRHPRARRLLRVAGPRGLQSHPRSRAWPADRDRGGRARRGLTPSDTRRARSRWRRSSSRVATSSRAGGSGVRAERRARGRMIYSRVTGLVAPGGK